MLVSHFRETEWDWPFETEMLQTFQMAAYLHPEILAKSGEVEQSTGVEKHMISTSEIQYSPFQKKESVRRYLFHASLDLQFVVGRVTNASEVCENWWENQFVVRTSDLKNILLTQLDSVPRILGEIRLIRKK